MQKISYDLRDRKTKIEQESSLRQIHQTLDSLGNNLMGMLWLMQSSLEALQEGTKLDQVKHNLEDALKAGNCAKDLMRSVLNSWKPKPVRTPISQPQAVPRIKLFQIYCSSSDNGEYLRQVITSSGSGIVGKIENLEHLPTHRVRGVDAVILEYHENDPKLDQWIQESTANPQGPPIYLYFHKFSMEKLWKALHLGVKECLVFPVREEQLRAAVNRIEGWSRTLTGKGGSGVKSRPQAHTSLAS